MELKVMMPAGKIPNGAKVAKLKGTKIYTVSDHITVFDLARKPSLLSGGSNKFLMDGSEYVSTIEAEAELVWYTTLEELNRMEREKEQQSPQ